MQVRSIISILAIAIGFVLVPILQAQAPARPDFSGTWDRPGAATRVPTGPGAVESPERGIPRQGFSTEEPPMQPWAESRYREARRGIPSLYQSGADESDPTHSCFPHGMPRSYTTTSPFEIVHASHMIVMLFEVDHWVRRIYTDGRGHPDGYPITWMGHAVGTWDGDTLVVDTVNINDQSWWLDNLAHPKTDALHIIERIRRPNQDTLEIDFTFDDPKAYTRPWNGKKIFELMPPGFEVMEQVLCEEYLDLEKKGRY